MKSGQKGFRAKQFDDFAVECVCLRRMRKEGIRHRRDECKIQEQSLRAHGRPCAVCGCFVPVRVRAEFL